MPSKISRKEREYYEPFPVPESVRGDGPLCQGGDLEPGLLIHAYSLGIFPWYSPESPIYWWSPDPRWILFPEKFHLSSRSLRKLKHFPFALTMNAAFADVIARCADSRPEGTWITDEMLAAYIHLHKLGYAHSIESWKDGRLMGGLYGLALGRAFFGESMFHEETEASRAALWGLVNILKKKNFAFIDCQQESRHMIAMGAEPLSRADFGRLLKESVFGGANPFKLDSIKLLLRGKLRYNPEQDEWIEAF